MTDADLETQIRQWNAEHPVYDRTELIRFLDEARAEIARLQAICVKVNDEIGQIAGKALGYPWFRDDQKNFPGATEENGVCVGEHVAETIVQELATAYVRLTAPPGAKDKKP